MRDSRWYVLYVSGGREKSLISFFQKEGLHAFTPMMEKLYKRQGQYQKVSVPMFPSYIFIVTDLEQREFNNVLWNLRQRKQGILKQLSYDNEGTSALRDEERRLLERLMDENHLIQHSIGMMEGDAIIITEGPLMGMESKIKKVDRHKRLAYLQSELLGKPIKISLEIVKKI